MGEIRLITEATELDMAWNEAGRMLLDDAGVSYIEQPCGDVHPSPQVEVNDITFRGIGEVERFVKGWQEGKYRSRSGPAI